MKLIKLIQRIFFDEIYTCICGHEANWHGHGWNGSKGAWVECPACRRNISGENKQDAIKRWNASIIRLKCNQMDSQIEKDRLNKGD